MEIVVTDIDEINLLAKEIAEATLTDNIDDEYEAYMDAAWAEHMAMEHAAHSYDLDAVAYGEF
jgi:hypothetical protein